MERSKTRVLAFLNMALHGLASAGCTGGGTGGELDSINQVSVVHAVSCVNKHRGTIVGLKLRLSGDCANNFANEAEVGGGDV